MAMSLSSLAREAMNEAEWDLVDDASSVGSVTEDAAPEVETAEVDGAIDSVVETPSPIVTEAAEDEDDETTPEQSDAACVCHAALKWQEDRIAVLGDKLDRVSKLWRREREQNGSELKHLRTENQQLNSHVLALTARLDSALAHLGTLKQLEARFNEHATRTAGLESMVHRTRVTAERNSISITASQRAQDALRQQSGAHQGMLAATQQAQYDIVRRLDEQQRSLTKLSQRDAAAPLKHVEPVVALSAPTPVSEKPETLLVERKAKKLIQELPPQPVPKQQQLPAATTTTHAETWAELSIRAQKISLQMQADAAKNNAVAAAILPTPQQQRVMLPAPQRALIPYHGMPHNLLTAVLAVPPVPRFAALDRLANLQLCEQLRVAVPGHLALPAPAMAMRIAMQPAMLPPPPPAMRLPLPLPTPVPTAQTASANDGQLVQWVY